MSTHNLCFEQKYEKYQNLSKNFQFSVVKFSIYLYRSVFVMMFLWRNKKNISTLGLKSALSGAIFTLYMAG